MEQILFKNLTVALPVKGLYCPAGCSPPLGLHVRQVYSLCLSRILFYIFFRLCPNSLHIFFPSDLATNILDAFLISAIRAACHNYPMLLDFMPIFILYLITLIMLRKSLSQV
jgi:hypothetical protein